MMPMLMEAPGQCIVGKEPYVTISKVWNEMDALPLAEGHCRNFNKAAKFSRMEGARAIFGAGVRCE